MLSFFKNVKPLASLSRNGTKGYISKKAKLCRKPVFMKRNIRFIHIVAPDTNFIETVEEKEHIIDVDHTTRESLETLTAMPKKFFDRKAIIYKESARATQQGRANTFDYVMRFDKADQWKNPYMGWTSSRDPIRMLRLKFPTKEVAIQFANDNGLKYEIEEPGKRDVVEKSYASNFEYVPYEEKDSTTSF